MSQQIVKNLGDRPVLYLDISSTCTGFVVAQLDNVTKIASITKVGVLWFKDEWEHGQKYKYLRDFITDAAYIHYKVNDIVSEKYFCNPNGGMGTAVVSEATGAVKSACFDVEPNLGFYDIGPPSWRSILGIKKDKTYTGSKAWKEPTKVRVEEILGIKLPERVISNINGKERKCPTDLWDALGICLAWLSSPENGCTKFVIEDKAYEVVTV
jgi:hypothetical protein